MRSWQGSCGGDIEDWGGADEPATGVGGMQEKAGRQDGAGGEAPSDIWSLHPPITRIRTNRRASSEAVEEEGKGKKGHMKSVSLLGGGHSRSDSEGGEGGGSTPQSANKEGEKERLLVFVDYTI